MSDLKDLPEFTETELGEALQSRTETLGSFRELGPPDLVCLTKTTGKAGSKDIGTYHFVSGTDASSSASLAAYVTSLTYTVSEAPGWFFSSTSSKPLWKIRAGVYSAFDAFSRVDVRVEVKIPGGVESYVIDMRGERHEATPEIWQQVYLSSLLRAILYADDANYRLAGFRKLDPITSLEGEQKFVAAAEALFFKAWQLGSDPEVQVATVVSNHLTSGIIKYFGDSFRWSPAVNLFEKLVVKEGEVASLLAQSYFGLNEEVKAVRVLHTAVQGHPQSYPLLHAQCDFLRRKGAYEQALALAKQAVNCAPSEFLTWAKLTEVNMELGRYTDALLTLNSCPMFTYNERDLHRIPPPAKSHLPMKEFISASGILDNEASSASYTDADVALLRLPAPSLRGTFARAYELLTKLVGKIGWDELLKCRSVVFVMEEEYRMQKAKKEVPPPSNGVKPNQTGVVVVNEEDISDEEGPGPLTVDSDDEASVKGMKSEAEGEPEEERLARPVAAQPKSEQAQEGQQEEDEGFSNKRLCERWLDNLFMVLYEDLRVYTIWRAEVAHFKAQHQPYRKTGTEWEILGDLALRLHHKEEGKDAYQRALDLKFSAKAWGKLLEFYVEEGDVQRSLNAAIRLSAYQHRWYQEASYPNAVAHQLFKLIKRDGLAKISYSLVSMNVPQAVLKGVMQPYFATAQTFRVEGSDF